MAKPSLLAIDDEPEFLGYVREVAEGCDFKVTTTRDAESFKSSYCGGRWDAIVLDIVMPDVEGIELLQWLIDRKCTARIVVVTGYDPKYAEMAKMLGTAMGLDVVKLAKPVAPDDLRAAITGKD